MACTPGVPAKSVRLTGQQLRGAFPDSIGASMTEAPVGGSGGKRVRRAVLPQMPPQEEVAPQPAVEVLDQTAGPATHRRLPCTISTHSGVTPS